MIPPISSLPTCFALLDDDSASTAAPRSRLYTGYVRSLCCAGAEELPAFFDALQAALKNGLHAVGLFSYELGAQLQGIATRTGDASPPAQVLLFDSCLLLSREEVQAWLASRLAEMPPECRVGGVAAVRAGTSEEAFNAALERIHAYLEAGDTYQVNYTYRLHFDAYGPPLALYARLRQRQPVPYGALIALPNGGAVLSLSPELFVRHHAGELVVRPMKGTAPASGQAELDQARAAELAADIKNRAENLMIVDLLRNDLGKVAVPGSVQALDLFKVERFGSVLQMTSTVRASLARQVSLAQVFAALYPCGSITGAPKRRTMEIIRELEAEPRGIYTGAIGWFNAPAEGHPIGDFCLSVPIRTLVLQAPQHGVRQGQMGVGAGIVYDSEPVQEYRECALKAAFLTGLGHEFELFETMYATREAGCRHLDHHLRRLSESAAYFGFKFDDARIRERIREECANLPDGPQRMRLALRVDGEISIQSAALTTLSEPVRLLLASEPVPLSPLFLRHKTTVRHAYDAAWRSAEAQGAFDMLFFNERGELTEGGRSNIFVKLDGNWYTPPLASGLLPGVMRAVLLDDPTWNARERCLTPHDLRRAQAIVACNALRGAMPAIMVEKS